MDRLKGWMLLVTLTVCPGLALEGKELVVVILSQDTDYHTRLAHRLRDNIRQQMPQDGPLVRIVPEDLSHPGAWTVTPLLPRLNRLDGRNSSWVFFCEERTVVSVANLLKGLSQFDHKQEQWVGYGLHDLEPSIIHHFAFADNPQQFKYPLFPAGFALTTSLVKRLVSQQEDKVDNPSEFSIDASHELALTLGIPLAHQPALFCLAPSPQCASYPDNSISCGAPLTEDEVYLAVKTCRKFHEERLPIVKDTWGKRAKHIEFFSDFQDESIPTTGVGVANTERGHCRKTIRILELSMERIQNLSSISWVVLADDDTIISVPRLQSVLSCFKPNAVIGERYGYNVKHKSGYNYITGGGGIAVGVEILPSILEHCRCPTLDYPDDMFLGLCLTRLSAPIIHSSLFHQARPMDYAEEYLETQEPVSFHKHWMLDPISVYNQWFNHLDHRMTAHSEL